MTSTTRVRPIDQLRIAFAGLTGRRIRTGLTATGIAIGIAAMVAVVGISASSRAALMSQLDELGTNVLTVEPGSTLQGDEAPLPATAVESIAGVVSVEQAASVSSVDRPVRRNLFDGTPYGLTVMATDGDVFDLLRFGPTTGRGIPNVDPALPVAVLGSTAAERLVIGDFDQGPTVAVGDRTFAVVGVLPPHPIFPDLNQTVFIGDEFAESNLGVPPNPSRIYLRVDTDVVEQSRPLISRTASPGAGNEVQVSRPSDALEAQVRVDEGLQRLLLALGAVSLVVGEIGIANIMVIAVLERRREIGLRRALGAGRGQIRRQFLLEAMALSTFGGFTGAALGAAVTAVFAIRQGWEVSVPASSLALAVLAALTLGSLAGLYPAARAARLDPADAVRPGT